MPTRFLRWGLLALALGGVLAVALGPQEREDAPPPPPPPAPRVAAPAPPASSPPPVAPPLPPAPRDDSREVLAAALREEMVPLASRVVVEAIERDREWVCAGEPMGLSARLGGAREPGAVYRWVWLTAGGEAELHPGPTLSWKAPEAAGRYAVRFQVCKDLGGRRVGVLAERLIEIDVRACGRGERQEHEPLRLGVTQRGQGAFLFQALASGDERIESHAWTFGDGATAVTTEPRVEHTYSVQELGPHELRSFTVRLEARRSRGGPLSATAFVAVRGKPPSDEVFPVEVEVSRWSPQPDGGFQSELVVRSDSTDVTWDRLERVTQLWDGGVTVETQPWSEVIRVEEELEFGGFRGHVQVRPAEVPPGTKQLLDFLYGRDTSGQEVVVSWSPFKSEPPPRASEPLELPPRK